MKRIIRTTRIVAWPFTNEPIPAVMAGMDIKRTDKICAVCGSLDQALAMLEYADEVLAVDRDIKQVAFAEYKAGLVRDGNFGEFFNPIYHPDHAVVNDDAKKLRDEYFSEKGRLERIRARLSRLEIRLEKDFLDALEPGRFAKAYLSNIIYYGLLPFKPAPEEQAEYIGRIANALNSPGLIYIANSRRIHAEAIADIVELDTVLSEKAWKHAKALKHTKAWQPAVYRAL